MLDPIKEDIEQIKLDQRGLKEETNTCTGKQLKRQIIKNEEKQKKLKNRISALKDQLLEKNVIFQGMEEEEFDDIQDTKTKIHLCHSKCINWRHTRGTEGNSKKDTN